MTAVQGTEPAAGAATAGVAAAPSAARGERPSPARAAAAWVRARALVLATGLAASVPVIVTAAHALVAGWTPLSDDAVMAIRAVDVLTLHPPLLGMPAGGATGVIDEQAYHLGPMLLWLLALPARWPGGAALPLTVGVVNVAAIMGVVGLAHRRGGPALMVAVAVAVPLMLASIPGAMHAAIWNPAAALLPFTLLVFLAWCVACGDHRLLPLAVVVASFVAQCHLTYVLPALGALAVAVAGLLTAARSGRASGRVGRWALAAVAAGLVCWSAPLAEQAVHRPGNLVLLARAGNASDPTLGGTVGVRALVRAVGVPPWWLRPPRTALERIGDLSTRPGAPAIVSAVLVLGGLAAALAAGLRRRRRDVAAACALALTLCGALALAAASVPQSAFGTVGYSLWWGSVAGMWAWIALGWSAAVLLLRPRRVPASRPRAAGAAGVAAVAAVAAAVAVGAGPRGDSYPGDETYARMREVDERVRAAVPASAPGGPVFVDGAYADDLFVGAGFQLGILYELRRHGARVTAPDHLSRLLGPRYETDGGPPRAVVHVAVDDAPRPPGRVLARVAVDPRDRDNPFADAPPRRTVTVTLVAPGARGRAG
jgi:hypothetical protein